MTTVNFSLPLAIETGHHEYRHVALWLGRAEISSHFEHDDDVTGGGAWTWRAEITHLWFCPDAQNQKFAHAVELPDNSRAGFKFKYDLEQAAISAYHNPTMQPAEMPDDEK